MNAATTAQPRFYDFEPHTDTLYEDVLYGLRQPQRFIPPKYFYDEQGSRLFDAICATEEYYPTRTEMAILEGNLEEICSCLGDDCVLVEPGSGSSQKVRLLLDQLSPHTYMPLDISGDYLKAVAHGLAREYPHIDIAAACIDFTAPLELPHMPTDRRRIAFFPGSSIGNFEPEAAEAFLGNLAELVGSDGGLLIGVDLKKAPEILHAAYNDRDGITARFNLNLLRHINRSLGADFDLDGFEHFAFYNDQAGRIEMHLISRWVQQVAVDGHRFVFMPGESIHTENSYKYTVEGFSALAHRAGFEARKVWVDPKGLFSVHYLEVEG